MVGGGILVVGVVVYGVWKFDVFTGDGLATKGPETLGTMALEKDECEQLVRRLHEKGIKGQVEYGKAKSASKACVTAMQTLVGQRFRNEESREKELKKFTDASRTFRRWGEDQLKEPPVVGAPDYVKAFSDMMKQIEEQGKDQRKFLIDKLEGLEFRSWDDVVKDK